MAEATPALEIRNLHKRYGDLEVLKGISLTAKDGDVISILGSSGSGKSTFLRCINLLETRTRVRFSSLARSSSSRPRRMAIWLLPTTGRSTACAARSVSSSRISTCGRT